MDVARRDVVHGACRSRGVARSTAPTRTPSPPSARSQPCGLTHLSLLAILAGASAQGNSTAFPPGWNHLAKSPPMGWRSWNAFGANINDKTFRNDAIDAVTAKVWDVGGAKASLFEVGYTRVGIDEGWENCSGTDPDHGLRQHNVDGTPMINVDKFPDLKGLVDYGHSKGVLMGWYLNGCACGEREERKVNYEGDVKLLDAFGFDAVKLDGCGAATNMTLYASLMQATGKAYETENCHWGHCGADSWFKNPDGSSARRRRGRPSTTTARAATSTRASPRGLPTSRRRQSSRT